MTPPAALDLLDTDDEGNPFYRNFSGAIPNGMRLPFGYDPSNTGPGRKRSYWGQMYDRGSEIANGGKMGSALISGYAR
jgi:hypothetical protein